MLCCGNMDCLVDALETDIVVKRERKAEETPEPSRQFWKVTVWLSANHVDDLLKDE